MNNKKSSKGITLIILIITVIILMIIISVSTYTGLESYGRAERTEFVSRMQLIQTKVDELIKEKNSEELEEIGEKIIDINNNRVIKEAVGNFEIIVNENNTYIKLTKQKIVQHLNLDIDDEIIININKREVLSVAGVRYNGKTYHTQYKLPEGQQIVQSKKVEDTLEFDYNIENQGLNAIITVIPKRNGHEIKNGIIKYKLDEEENYKQVSKNIITITKSGKYVIQVSDRYSTEPERKEITIKLINSPMLKTNWKEQIVNENEFTNLPENDEWYNYADGKYAYAKNEEGEYYIWIPRCAKNKDEDIEDIKFIKGNSNTFTDETIYNNEEWEIPLEFSPNNIKLTGFWLKVTEPNLTKTMNEYLKNLSTTDITYVYE